jgi:hypothetical protein
VWGGGVRGGWERDSAGQRAAAPRDHQRRGPVLGTALAAPAAPPAPAPAPAARRPAVLAVAPARVPRRPAAALPQRAEGAAREACAAPRGGLGPRELIAAVGVGYCAPPAQRPLAHATRVDPAPGPGGHAAGGGARGGGGAERAAAPCGCRESTGREGWSGRAREGVGEVGCVRLRHEHRRDTAPPAAQRAGLEPPRQQLRAPRPAAPLTQCQK